MDGSSHTSTQISGTSGNGSKMFSNGELSNLINDVVSFGKSFENFSEITTILHGDDSELIFFIDPN